jgi:glutamate synthase (NADPH/NADH) small chain
MEGIFFAMDFLRQQNKINRGIEVSYENRISAKDKNVIVLGGGDTGSDCVGTVIRQGARKVIQIEILPKPFEVKNNFNPSWPYVPKILKTTTSHEEGCERRWGLSTRRFLGEQQKVTGLEVIGMEWEKDGNGSYDMREIPGTVEIIQADMVLLSLGFLHPTFNGLLKKLGIELDARQNVKVDEKFLTNNPKVFAAGDAKDGASLVVKAIYSGRKAAEAINRYLKGQ